MDWLFLLIKSNTLPGVPTTISTPFFKALICLSIGWPPYIGKTESFSCFPSLTSSSLTCIASSLVGAKISAFGDFFFPEKSALFIIAHPKAAVLPVPVWAWPIISCPSRATGILSACIWDGS